MLHPDGIFIDENDETNGYLFINKTDLGKFSNLVIVNIKTKKAAIVILDAFMILIKSFIEAYRQIPL